MKRIRCIGMVVLLGLGASLPLVAQQAATVFEIDPGVAILGAAGAGLSVVHGAETLYYNPAGLTRLEGISLSSFYASYLGQASYSAFALASRNWGAAVLLVGSTGIQGYDDAGNPTDALAYRNTGLVFGAGVDPSAFSFLRNFPLNLSVGARLKLLSVTIGEEKGSGFSFDLGFRTTFPDVKLGGLKLSDLGLGIAAVNLFGNLSYDAVNDDFPMDIQVGASARLLDQFGVAFDLHLGGSLHVGFTYEPIPTFALRLGLISRDGLAITAGLGVDVDGFLLDYAFVSHRLGGTHRVSLTLDFAALDVGALGRSFQRLIR